VRQRLVHHGAEVGLVAGADGLPERPDAVADVAGLVARHGGEAGAEAGEEVARAEDAQDAALARQGEQALHHQVVDGDAPDPAGAVAGLEPHGVGEQRQQAVPGVEETAVAAPVPGRGADVGEGVHQPARHAEDLLEDAREEVGVARLVHDLGGEEEAVLLVGGADHQRREGVGDGLLAVEEAAEGALELLADRGVQAPPLLAVHAEVDGGGGPLLPLPAPVEVDGPGELPPQEVHVRVDDVGVEVAQALQGRGLHELDGLGLLHRVRCTSRAFAYRL
jgi:hypothetical protein